VKPRSALIGAYARWSRLGATETRFRSQSAVGGLTAVGSGVGAAVGSSVGAAVGACHRFDREPLPTEQYGLPNSIGY
jgi:hypothetical protein